MAKIETGGGEQARPCLFDVMQDGPLGNLDALNTARRTRLLSEVGIRAPAREAAIAHVLGYLLVWESV